MINSYDEYNHPGRRKEDRLGKHVHIRRQVNITIEAGGITNGGQLVVSMDASAHDLPYANLELRQRSSSDTE